ncbi:hypothetical protein HDV05_007580 [Chytridiales sp. JEL 0842]|nr:hypothetical protein HDV05_007580 [Chytridiales sp. JEL 0842]
MTFDEANGGNCIPMFRRLFAVRPQPVVPMTVAIFGIDGAGKSSLLMRLKGDSGAAPKAAWGFATHTIKTKIPSVSNLSLTLYDIGGGAKIRGIWTDYMSEIHGCIFVVDASGRERLDEVTKVLHNLLEDNRMLGKPVLILANKQDVQGAISKPRDLAEKLGISFLYQSNRMLRIQPCSTEKMWLGKRVCDQRINKGITWLLSTINTHLDTLTPQIERDVAIQKEKWAREKEEQRLRIQRYKQEREEAEADPGAAPKAAWGFATQTIKTKIPHVKPLPLTLYDIGGDAKIRGIWTNYMAEIHGCIFIVDAANKDRMKEVADVFHNLFKDDKMKGKPFLILANKQDVKGAISNPHDLAVQLGIMHLLPSGSSSYVDQLGHAMLHIQPCATEKTMFGKRVCDKRINTGVKWLLSSVYKNIDTIAPQIERDVAIQKEQWAKEKEEKRIRIEQYRREQDSVSTPAASPQETEHANPSTPLQTLVFSAKTSSNKSPPVSDSPRQSKASLSSNSKRETNTVHPTINTHESDPMTASPLPPADMLPPIQSKSVIVSELIETKPPLTALPQVAPSRIGEPILRTSKSTVMPGRYGLGALTSLNANPSMSEIPGAMLSSSKSTSFNTAHINEMLTTESVLAKARLPPIEKKFLTSVKNGAEQMPVSVSRAAEPTSGRLII